MIRVPTKCKYLSQCAPFPLCQTFLRGTTEQTSRGIITRPAMRFSDTGLMPSSLFSTELQQQRQRAMLLWEAQRRRQSNSEARNKADFATPSGKGCFKAGNGWLARSVGQSMSRTTGNQYSSLLETPGKEVRCHPHMCIDLFLQVCRSSFKTHKEGLSTGFWGSLSQQEGRKQSKNK